MLSGIIEVLVPAALAFVIGMTMTPLLTRYLYRYKVWKKRAGKISLNGDDASEFNRLHGEEELKTPRMGGIVVWGSVALTTLGIAFVATLLPDTVFSRFNFLSRSQTWIPLATLLVGAFIGFIDDLMVIRPSGEGMRLRYRLLAVVLVALFVGWWFWAKLDVHTLNIPFSVPLEIGWLTVPLFVIISLALYASGVIDGIDGLSGGVFTSLFGSYAIIAFVQGEHDLAAFCAAIIGGLLAFLWFNIPPARFYMSDTGTFALTLVIGVIAFMTDSLGGGYGISVLPIIGALLFLTVLSDIAQITSKKLFGKKVLLIAPLHHHFEAIGWPGPKVVMRYWVLSIMFAFLGVILALAAL